jgi:hypothetical protein
MKPIILSGTTLALAAAGCTSVEVADTGESVPQAAIASYEEGWPAEFFGQTFEIVTPSGVTNVVNLAPDGTMTIVPELSTDVVKGKWAARGAELCTEFSPRGEECWASAPVIAANGDFVTVRSDRGQQLKIRLLNEREEEALDASG